MSENKFKIGDKIRVKPEASVAEFYEDAFYEVISLDEEGDPRFLTDDGVIAEYAKHFELVEDETKPEPPIAGHSVGQVGGTHYQTAISPWDYIIANDLGFWEGNIVKYVTRWKTKGGVEDLKKAQHYLQKLIELSEKT